MLRLEIILDRLCSCQSANRYVVLKMYCSLAKGNKSHTSRPGSHARLPYLANPLSNATEMQWSGGVKAASAGVMCYFFCLAP